MNIANLYRKTKQILSDSNAALANKGLNTVNSLYDVLTEVGKLNDSMNRLPYYFTPYPNEITENDLGRITTIGEYVFYNRDGLTSVTIPDSVTTISYDAFSGCSNLENVTIPDSVTTIADNAFSGCKNLINITIPDSVTGIGGNAFYGTGYYNNPANWESGVLYIGKHLVKANYSIVGAYEIKTGTLTIAYEAFKNCTSLTSVIIPDSLTSINGYAFYLCSNLESVTISDSVTNIGWDAFYGCNELSDIYLRSTTPPALRNKSAIPTTTIIHVPIGSGDAYKSATNWSYHSNNIVEDIEVG